MTRRIRRRNSRRERVEEARRRKKSWMVGVVVRLFVGVGGRLGEGMRVGPRARTVAGATVPSGFVHFAHCVTLFFTRRNFICITCNFRTKFCGPHTRC